MQKTISYQGTLGAFSQQACQQYYPDYTAKGYGKFAQATAAVRQGEADYAMIPVENSTAGRVMEVYQILPEAGLFIVAEHLLPIHHCLFIPQQAFRGQAPAGLSPEAVLAWKQQPLTSQEQAEAFKHIREVRSHPQGLAQCRQYLQQHVPHAHLVEVWDTAGAARDITGYRTAEVAAIAPITAADHFTVSLLAQDIEDIKHNTTRFLVFATEALDAAILTGPVLTTVLFEIDHRPGALVRVLQVFEKHGVSLTKLETYMVGAEKPNPSFYVDIAANLGHPDAADLRADLAEVTLTLRSLGSYPASESRVGSSSFLGV